MSVGKKKITPDPGSVSKKASPAIRLLLAFFIPVILYAQTISFGLSGLDDTIIIDRNISFLEHLDNIPAAFMKDAFGGNTDVLYRPIQTISYMVDVFISGGNHPWMYHLTNVLLFGLCSVLILILMDRLGLERRTAFFFSMLYAVHPLFAATVSWLPSRGDLFLTIFTLIFMIGFIRFLRKRDPASLGIHWVAFTMALFSKETAVMLPVLALLYFILYVRDKRFDYRFILLAVLYGASLLLWHSMRIRAIASVDPSGGKSGLNAFFFNLPAIPASLSSFFVPVNFSTIPAYTWLKTITGIAVVCILVFVILKKKMKISKPMVFGLVWFLLLMFPPMLFRLPYLDYFEHRFYLPLIGILIFLAALIPQKTMETLLRNKSLFILVLGLPAFLTVVKTRGFANPGIFFDKAIGEGTSLALPWYNRGSMELAERKFQSAEADLTRAVECFPGYSLAYCNRGIARGNLGDLPGALGDFNEAIRIKPDYADAYYNRGFAYFTMGRNEDAIRDFTQSAHFSPRDIKSYVGLGATLIVTGNNEKAVEILDKAISLDPASVDAYNNRARARFNLKDYTGAVADCRKVLELDPGNPKAISCKTDAENGSR